MPHPKLVTNKITQLENIAVEEYGVDEKSMDVMMKRANFVNSNASDLGFNDTDAFVSESGIIVVTAYKNGGCIEITLLHNDLSDILIERDAEIISYHQNQRDTTIIEKLRTWERLWDSSVLSEGTPTIQREKNFLLSPSTDWEVAFRSLTPSASRQRVLIFAST